MMMQWARRSPATLVGVSMVTAIMVFLFDVSMPLGIAGGAPYLAIVMIGYWAPWWYYIYLMAGLASLLTLIGYFLSPEGGDIWMVLVNRGVTLFAIWIAALFCAMIQKKEGNFRAAIDNAFDGIININSAGMIESFNMGAQKMFGYTPEEILGKNVSILMPPAYREGHDNFLSRYLATGESRVIGTTNIFKAQHKNGTIFPIELSVSESKYGGRSSFIGIIRDITERVRTEEQMIILSRAIEQSPVSIVITDTSGNIEYVNPRFTETSGYSYEEVIGKNTNILKSLESQPDEYKALWQTITSGEEWRGIFHNIKKDGEPFWESVSVSPVRNLDGVITHFLSVKEDITGQLESEQKLAHALKLEATGQLTSGIAHDFNNILTIIAGNLQLIMEEDTDIDNAEMKEILNDVLSAAHDGEELIHRLLLLLRKNKPAARHVEVNSLITNLRKVLARMLDKYITVGINLDEQVNTIFVDPHQLESAMLNLAVNARDAMPEGGEFIIETDLVTVAANTTVGNIKLKHGNYIAIKVKDTGAGMDAGVLKRVFEPFFTTKAEGKGSGLGMSMVYNFARQAGGDVYIVSTPGNGTEITLFLPESYPLGGSEEEKRIPEHIPRGTETILIVEDNANVRRFAVRTLHNLGYQVLETDDSDKAMEILSANGHTINLLFSDIIIPGKKNGVALALWAMKLYPQLEILLTTGLRTELLDEQTTGDDHFNILRKPYSLEKLADSIRERLDTPAVR